jgi:Ca2+-binding EF-hand superfamily protein
MEEKMQKRDKINLNEIIGYYVVKNISAFKSYLKQLWNDLSKREGNLKNGIDRISFGKYYDLPGLISERLFSVFDSKNKGYLTLEDFTNSMIILFSGDYAQLLNFIFDFYDFDKDQKITKEDIRIVLSYVPLYKKIKHYEGLKFEKDNFEDRLASQKELHEKLDDLFKLKTIINFEEFKFIVQNINSDIFLYILVFLMERRPFSNETIKNLDNIKKNNNINNIININNKNIFIKKQIFSRKCDNLIVLPNVNSKLIVSRTISAKNPSIEKIEKELNNNNDLDYFQINELESGTETLRTNGTVQKKPSRKTLKNVSLMDIDQTNENNIKYDKDEGMLDYARPYELYYDNNRNNIEEEFNSTNMTNISRINNNILTEGYLFKIQENKVKKIYFKLICKDLYYYKSKNNKRHKGMHNLSGVFIQSNGLVKLGDKQFYCFTIIFPTKSRKYYLSNESEYHNWVNTIRKIVGYSNLNEIYEIRQVLGKGKFGLVKLGIHRGNGRKVAIKIINKKLVTAIDVQQVKTEIDILKIAKHPNIIQLYDVLENENYIYIIMEYCAGGDLFSYIEKRGFRLPETRAAEIIHKLSTAVFFLHEYGVVHRDLKPENILMTDNSPNADIRLVDFGLGKIIGPGEMCTDPFGTFSYVAPEVLKEKPYSFKVDLFAIGIIAYLLVAGFLPFDHETSEKEIARQTVYEPTPFPTSVWKNISNEARAFVDNLLQKNPKKRMGIQEVLQHKWLQKYNSKEIISFKKRNERDLSGAQKFEAFSTLSKV